MLPPPCSLIWNWQPTLNSRNRDLLHGWTRAVVLYTLWILCDLGPWINSRNNIYRSVCLGNRQGNDASTVFNWRWRSCAAATHWNCNMAAGGVNQPCKVIRIKQQTPKGCDESILLTVCNISVTGRSFHYCWLKEMEGCGVSRAHRSSFLNLVRSKRIMIGCWNWRQKCLFA
jgi:hypothetical protein